MVLRRNGSVACLLASLSACAGLSQLQAPVSRFSEAAHAAAAAETSFQNAAIKIDCEDQFYSAAGDYVHGQSPNFDISGSCSPRSITPAQIQTRQALLDAIVLYSDKLLALASAGDDKQLGTNATTLAQRLNALAASGNVRLSNPSLVQGVEVAFTAVAQMVLDQVKYRDIKQAAQDMQGHIADVVAALQSENFALGRNMLGSLGKMEVVFRSTISPSPHGPASSRVGETFSQIVSQRMLLAGANPLAPSDIAQPNQPAGPGGPAQSVNAALDAIVTANAAIAQTGPGGIYAAANDLYQRATAAKDQYTAISSH